MICESWEGGTIDGKFPLLEWLGGWADHCVFLTVRRGTEQANIKLIPASGADAEAHLAYWETAKSLSHPNLLKLMESGRYTIHGTEVVYVITEKADTFLSALIPRKALDASDVKCFLEPVVEALMFLHEEGFGHGSVRPSNIILVGTQWKLASEKMASGEIAGRKPAGYDAPEVSSGALTPASDVWSLGMIVVEAFEQRIPSWDSETKSGPEVPNTLPEPFKRIARGCLRWDPSERISISEVRALLAGDALPSRRSEPIARWSEPVASESGVQSEDEGEIATEDADSFAPAEPVEFAPRSRLFSNLGEEERASRKAPKVLAALVVLAVLAVLAVSGFRNGWFHLTETEKAPVPSQPATQTPQPQITPEASQSASANAGQPAGAPPSQPASGGESAPPLNETSPGSQPPETDTAPAATKQPEPAEAAPTSEPPVHEPETGKPVAKEAANSSGAVMNRVLPNVSPEASGSMRRAVEVELRVSVNEYGSVSNVEYTTLGPGNYFARKARQAAQLWKFKPPETEGHAEASEWVLLFQFDRRRTDVTATEVR